VKVPASPSKGRGANASTDDAQGFFGRQRPVLLREKGITEKSMFGTAALCINGKVFMFAWKGQLVLKLPEDHVGKLLASMDGKLFDPGHGRTSKTWIALFPSSKRRWPKLVESAREFVAD
jgi:TfoX N-terminal domain